MLVSSECRDRMNVQCRQRMEWFAHPRFRWAQLFRRRRGAAVCGATLLLLWTLIHLLAAVPQLHHAFHTDAGSAGHECLLTEMASGGFDPAGHQACSPAPAPVPLQPSALQSAVSPRRVLHEPYSPRPPPTVIQSLPQAGS